MFLDYDAYRYCIKPGATDMRCGERRLVEKIQDEMELDPFERIIFLFCGKDAKRIKAVVWDGDGFWLMSKHLQAGTFAWPRSPEEALILTRDDVARLLHGEDIFRRIPICKNGFIY